MKNYIILFFCILLSVSLNAQTKVDEPAYKKDPNIPNFTILLTDSTWFSKDNLPKGKYDYTFIVYFSPDCGHCQQEATGIVKKMDSLKNVFFVFVAYKSLEEVRGFASYYALDKFPNVVIGRDPKYYVPSFYRVTRVPFLAVYNKAGKLQQVFDPAVTDVPDAAGLIEYINQKH